MILAPKNANVILISGLSLRDHLEVVARNNEEDAYSNTSSFAFSDEEANEIESEEEIPLDDEFSSG